MVQGLKIRADGRTGRPSIARSYVTTARLEELLLDRWRNSWEVANFT